MLKSTLLQRWLRQELPGWVAQGWVAGEHQEAILASVSGGRSLSGKFLPYALYLLGVILGGTGVFVFFAANWQELAKIIKLALLFGGLWLAYGLAWAVQTRRSDFRHGVNALLLLGVMLFGANIMLIAQIYHIDAHFPNGILTWALGGMLTAYLMRSQPAMVAALALALVWSGMERWSFGEVFHWPFLVFCAAALPAIHRNQWRFALHAAMVGLLWWSLQATVEYGSDHRAVGGRLYAVQLFGMAYLALTLLAARAAGSERPRNQAEVIERYASAAAVFFAYRLTYPTLHSLGWAQDEIIAVPPLGIVLTLMAMALVLGLSLWNWRNLRREAGALPVDKWAWALLATALVLVAMSLPQIGRANLMAVLFNLLFFAGLVWLIMLGYQQRDLFKINLGFIFFAVVLLSRYFDTFWSQLGRSFFFMGGGLLLAGGGYWMDRKRRQLISRMGAEQPGAGQ